MSTKRKTGVVTGAPQGISAAITNLFRGRGYDVLESSRHISSKNEPRISATVLPTFSRRFHRVAGGLAASLALGALSAASATPATCGRRSPPSSRRTTPSSCKISCRGGHFAIFGN